MKKSESADQYPFLQQLLALDGKRPSAPRPLPEALYQINTPTKVEVWQRELEGHPDKAFSHYILQGLEQGFRVGFEYSSSLLPPKRNMLSATQHREVVSDYLREELALNRVVQLPKPVAVQLGIHCNPIGVIPKRYKPNKWRLIVDLSSPGSASVNDGIDKEMCSLSYTSVDAVVEKILDLGRNALLAKLDIKQAYRMIPVHPQDRLLLGMEWEEYVYVDKALPFGLRSAPIIFTAVADALQWIMQKNGASYVDHYIDDFITAGKGGSDECSRNFTIMHKSCEATGTPVEPEKSIGPTTVIVFLGIELDTEVMEIRLPADKLARLVQSLKEWRGKKACHKRELLSIVGLLSHACKVIRPGRSFLRRLIDLSSKVSNLDHFVRLNQSARSDLEWWFQFAKQWNGKAMIYRRPKELAQGTLVSDASGSWGCGAFFRDKWFQLEWAGNLKNAHISVKELVPIAIAAAIWGPEWSTESIEVKCDNAAVVAVLNSGNSRNPELMHFMRCLSFFMAKFQFTLRASHIAGSKNVLADALSRNNVDQFLLLHPQASRRPAPIPQELVDLLIVSRPDWTSSHWTRLWSSIF